MTRLRGWNKELRGFIGLTGYYQWYVKDYRKITALLIDFLKTYAFNWSEEAINAVLKLKKDTVALLVLDLSNFEEKFIIELVPPKLEWEQY